MANAASPYLQTHKNDLVQWHPWGDAAFALARERGVPVMVSFGYTACHWCHVMQETHFNDAVTAKAINDNFVSILVDRERRPALDEAYMLVTEVLTQRGGWPNTVFMTPDRKPFYGTAYVPLDEFSRILSAIMSGWEEDKPSFVAEGERLSMLLGQYMIREEAAQSLTLQVHTQVASALTGQFDPFSGGMGEAPKFFQQPVLLYLLQRHERTGHPAALEVVERTLQAVLRGGIHDHLEGGFHRYAVDQAWRVPHFEKMLYDQAQMASAFTTAYRITGKPEYAATARKTLDYILADLTAPAGGFYSTRDADSEGEEGAYYVWTEAQLAAVLGADDAAFAANMFGTIADGEFAGKIILNTDDVDAGAAARVNEMFGKLEAERHGREKPRRDEKVVASWNGMAITALADAATVLDEPRYAAAAAKAGEFIWSNMRCAEGMLKRSHYGGGSQIDGELEDYAQLARGFLALFDATADRKWLERAGELAGQMRKRFGDDEAGDFYGTADMAGFARAKPRNDADSPSANGVALDVLARLARRTGDLGYRTAVEKAIAALSGVALKNAAGGVSVLGVADRFENGETGLVQYAGNGVVRAQFVPDRAARSLTVRLTVADGWHLNADKPLEDHLIPTEMNLSVAGKKIAAKPVYPAPLTKTLKFNAKPMALYEGVFEISASLDDAEATAATFELQVQTCSDEICLLPETLRLNLGFPGKEQKN